MLESQLRKNVVKLLKPLHAFAVENGMCCPGTPDVNCSIGWIELKATKNWPVRPSTIVSLDHPLSPQQRIWLLHRHRSGGKAWVLLWIGGDWVLFSGETAAAHLGRTTKQEMLEDAIAVWHQTPTQKDLIECLRREN